MPRSATGSPAVSDGSAAGGPQPEREPETAAGGPCLGSQTWTDWPLHSPTGLPVGPHPLRSPRSVGKPQPGQRGSGDRETPFLKQQSLRVKPKPQGQACLVLGRPVGTSLFQGPVSRGWGRPWSCCSLEEVTLPHGRDLLGVPGAGARQGSLSSPCVGPGDLECPWGCLFLPMPCVPHPWRRACSLSQGLRVPAEPLPLWACPAARSSPSCTAVRNLEPPDLEARPQGPGSTFYELLPPLHCLWPGLENGMVTDPASWVAGGFKTQRKLQAPKGGHGCRADIQPSSKSVKSHQGPECRASAGRAQGGRWAGRRDRVRVRRAVDHPPPLTSQSRAHAPR